MDLASLLPVIALNIQPGNAVLDLCAGPGGKSLAILQTLLPKSLYCNDISKERLKRLRQVIDSYVNKDTLNELQMNVTYDRNDGAEIHYGLASTFDRVLCDVPCFTDRQAITDDDMDTFKRSNYKTRVEMPKVQVSLLSSAIKCLKPGGECVYSTCTLSPIQNDGVVAMAIKNIWEETNIEYVINDCSSITEHFDEFLQVEKTRYGHLIMPNLLNNFGPMYFAKIKRTK